MRILTINIQLLHVQSAAPCLVAEAFNKLDASQTISGSADP